MTQQDDITQRVQTAEQEAVRRALEAYAESYDMMARVAKREGRDASVGVHAVAYDIRRNMVNAVLRALSKLRATVADERALDLLDTLFTAYENGTPCYEEPDSQGGYLGMAFRIDDDTFRACADLLNKERPRTAGALATAPADPEAAEVDFLVRVLENLDTWRAEEWSELLERRPAILALLRPLVLASATPPEFRDVLLAISRSAGTPINKELDL